MQMLTDLRLYLRLLQFARPYWRIAAISILAMVSSAALEPMFPALMQPLIDKSLIQREGASLWQVPVFIVVVFVLKGLADYVANVSSYYIAQRTIADLRALVFAKQLDLPMAAHQKEAGGRMLSRVTHEANLIGDAVSTAWLTLIRDTLVLIGLLGFLFYTAWKLTLLVLFVAPLLAMAIRATNRRIRTSSERAQGFMGRISGLVEEALAGLQEIKIFSAHAQQAERFQTVNHALRRENMRALRVQALNVPLVQILAACSVALVIFVASLLSRQDELTPGEFVAFITAMSMIFEPIRRLANVSATLQKGLAAAESLFGLLDQVGEAGSETTLIHASDRLTGSLRFEQVSYSYPGQSGSALREVSLMVEEGEAVALVGPSGAGKSTLLYLLAGFDRPNSGRIFIGNRDLADVATPVLRASISMVAQRTVLFDLPVRDNIRLARPEAKEEEVIEAAKRANAWSFICDLPEGLDTPMGPHGLRLSGGQRQRISIARAFLKNTPILILDEPTSALDAQSEAEVLSALEALAVGRTTIVVSHAPERLGWVSRRIVVEFYTGNV